MTAQKDDLLEVPEQPWRDYRTGPDSDGRRGPVFRKAWMFKGDAISRILQILEQAKAPHPWVHVCCGNAVIPGEDVRVDLYHPSATLQVDAQDLDKHIQDAGAIIIDPPYGWDRPVRMRASHACARALGPGGVLVVHAPWQPKFPRAYMRRLEPAWIREDDQLDWADPPVSLVGYVKTRDPKKTGARGREAHETERRRRGKA